uniref:Uncharacterized protein n=1 Tax=Solanum lycopersicum TaxID=4081 RepID=A0A3Q7IJ74_SOLLC
MLNKFPLTIRITPRVIINKIKIDFNLFLIGVLPDHRSDFDPPTPFSHPLLTIYTTELIPFSSTKFRRFFQRIARDNEAYFICRLCFCVLHATLPHLPNLLLILCFDVYDRFDFRIFMNTRTTVVSAVSCKSGNKNGFFCWILLCLLSKFFKTATLNVHSFEAFGKACLL